MSTFPQNFVVQDGAERIVINRVKVSGDMESYRCARCGFEIAINSAQVPVGAVLAGFQDHVMRPYCMESERK
jgi:hypothetical protein